MAFSLAALTIEAQAGETVAHIEALRLATVGSHSVQRLESLQVNTSLATRTVVALERDEALEQILDLASQTSTEEQWAFLTELELWVELGINEKADGEGSEVELDSDLLARLIEVSTEIELYHYHPTLYFEQLAGELDNAPETPVAGLTAEQYEAIGLALPSPSDIRVAIEVAVMVEQIDKTLPVRHFVVSPYGVVSYGPTPLGQRKLAFERGYPLASLNRELEVSMALHRSPLGVERAAQARPGLSIRGLLDELCRRMSSEMFVMRFEPH